MDFAKLDLKTASEAGSWVQFEHDGEPLFNDEKKPCRVHIRGMAEPSVLAAIRSYTRLDTLLMDRLGRAADKDAENVLKSFEPRIESAAEALIVLAVDKWENITWDGKPMDFTPENVLKVCGSKTLFFGQVRDAIMEHKRLFKSAAKG
jgi:hypothetical protein